jgi:cytochrome P450
MPTPSFSPAVLAIFALPFVLVVYLYSCSKKAKLDHIPGPWLAKYTNAWRGYQAWQLNHDKEGAKNYQIEMIGRYGDAVRIGPANVLVYDPAAIETILGFKQRLDKGPGYQVFVMTGTSQTALVGIRDEKTHSVYRRPIAHAYSLSSLKGYEPYIDEMISKLVAIFDQHGARNEPINVTRWSQFCMFATLVLAII